MNNTKIDNQIIGGLLKKDVENLELPSPSVNHAIKINALFSKDPDVFTIFNYNVGEFKVLVKGAKKAEALNFLLGSKKFEGENFRVRVIQVLENGYEEELPVPSWKVTAEGYFDFLKTVLTGIGFKSEFDKIHVEFVDTTYYFCEVEAIPISFKNDNFGNPKGYSTMLPEDLIKEAFDVGPIMVSTLVPEA